MAVSIADLNIRIKADTSTLSSSLNGAANSVAKFGGSIAGIGLMAGGAAGAVQAAVQLMKESVAQAIQFGRAIVNIAAEAESAEAGFRVLLGDAAEAKALMADVRGFAAKTPFETGPLADSVKLVMQYGVAAKDSLATLKLLGDVASGDQEKLQRLSLAYGQVIAKGRLRGQELNQLSEAGFNPMQMILGRTGESANEFLKRMEAGKVMASEVTIALIDATRAGGRFNDAMAIGADTFNGKWSTLKDSVTLLALEWGERFLPALKTTVDYLTASTILMSEFSRQALDAGEKMSKFVAKGLDTVGLGGVFRGAGEAIKAAAESASPFGDVMDRVRQRIAEMRQELLAGADAERKMAEAADALAESQKRLDTLKSWADGMVQSLRTPFEVAADTISKMNEALYAGFLTAENYGRSFLKVVANLEAATMAKREFDVAVNGTGAVTRNTTAGFSAIASAQIRAMNTQGMERRQERTNDLLDKLVQIMGQAPQVQAVGVR